MARPKKKQLVTEPVLMFVSRTRRHKNVLLRNAEPRPCKNADRLQISHFPMYNRCPLRLTIRNSFLAGFQVIEEHMAPSVAEELVDFLANSWKTYIDIHYEGPSPTGQKAYHALLGLNNEKKLLSYCLWFYLAAWYGPGHPDLQSIRQEMSNLWGVEFPTDTIIYPANISVENQEKLFYGIPVDIKPNLQALPSVSQVRDTEMQDRIQDFKNTLETTPVEDLARIISQRMPTRAETADRKEIDSLKAQLATTRSELERTRKDVSGLESKLDKEKAIRQADYLKFDKQLSKSNKREKNLEGLIADTNRRVDKAMETCALLLSIVSAPGGEKRKRDDQA
ncbi:hypothetical protein FHETE_9130 [Fusarium heterosporum]|uniref:Uncharacterized protein n=1 Tax=Fusarium heterosporum TaxID=42747 RepID=A0A8H5T0K3_FUSHE|nr:hypothetical protein FHETE_9130 [Fusarium heterosporum]